MGIQVDTRGRSCPEPVMMTKKVLDQGVNEDIEIISDSQTALENISRYVKNAGYEIEVVEEEDILITVKSK